MDKISSFNLTEFVDIDILKKLYPNNNIWKYDRVKYYDMLCNVSIDNELRVEYKKNKYSENHYGRFYNNQKINGTSMSRRARATLYGAYEYDIDMVAAHQNILKNIFVEEYGFETFETKYPILNNYINNRDKVIADFKIENIDAIIEIYNKENNKDIVKKDIVKDFHTMTLYGGSMETWLNEYQLSCMDIEKGFINSYITPFKKEVKSITSAILKIDKYSQLIDDVKNENEAKKNNKKIMCDGKYLSIILQEEESNIVNVIINYIKRFAKEWNITIYSYDGFQVRHKELEKNEETDKLITELVNKINVYIKKQFKVDNYTFISKPFSNPFDEEELNNIDETAQFIIPYFRNTNTDELGFYISNLIKNDVVVCRDTYYFYNGEIWEDISKEGVIGKYRTTIYNNIKKSIKTYIDIKDAKERKKMDALIDSTSNSLLNGAFANALKCKINDRLLFDSKNHLLNAPNGTFNLDTNELQPHNPTDYITKMVNYPISVDFRWRDGKIVKTLKNDQSSIDKVVDLMKGWFDTGAISQEEVIEITTFILYYVGKSLHGNNFIERAIVLMGKLSRNGKSTFIDILQKTFGDYVGQLSLNYFTTYDKTSNSPHPELLAIQGCRIINVAEAGGDDYKIIPQKFKTLVGGDTISERTLYSKKLVSFKNTAIFFLPSNYQLSFTTQGNDTSGKLEYIEFNNYFGDIGTIGWDEKKPNHKKIDKDFKYKLTDDLFKSVLQASLILRTRNIDKPRVFIEWNEKNNKEVNSVDTWLNEHLSYDKNDIYFTEEDWIIKHNIFPALNCKFEKNPTTLERMITFDYIYNMYSKDNKEEKVSNRNFYSILRIKYKDFIPTNKTTLFGGSRKEHIKGWKLNVFETEE